MKYYQFSIYRDDKKVLQFTDIIEKEGNTMIDLDTGKVSIIEWYDQEKGRILVFLIRQKELLEAFLDGMKIGAKQETLL